MYYICLYCSVCSALYSFWRFVACFADKVSLSLIFGIMSKGDENNEEEVEEDIQEDVLGK